MGFKPAQIGLVVGISLLVSVVVTYASNRVDAVEEQIG